ncbi:MAG: N-acetyl-gamma-glutamyl-phosphate reductase [Proteobacteria bacterium]|nr:N-acetyl-gamma-glutamyl-phosphate reductase [Pseudomonadota bacterium]
MHKEAYNVAVVGGSGYSGLELTRLLKKHPKAQLKASVGTRDIDTLWTTLSILDTVFLATPAEVSIELAPKILAAGVHVIDLSGAFRLKTSDIAADYTKWYNLQHSEVRLVEQAHYGLVPWTKPPFTTSPTLIANPGCYATAILMGLLPLLNSRLIKPETLVIDAKSGTTGAGKKAVESQLFSEVEGECLPYKVGKHQHLPEITLYAKKFSSQSIDPFLTTSLLPVRRGITAGLYAQISPGKGAADVELAFKEYYAAYPFTLNGVSLKRVVGTPSTQFSIEVVGDKLYLFSSLDNLLKGAASQAVENFNLLHQLPVETGLTHLEAII